MGRPMTVEIRVPTLGESVTEATVAKWLKTAGREGGTRRAGRRTRNRQGDARSAGAAGWRDRRNPGGQGGNVPVGAVLGTIADGAAAPAPSPVPGSSPGRERERWRDRAERSLSPQAGRGTRAAGRGRTGALDRSGPAVRKLVAESGVDVNALTPTGPGGRLTKADVIAVRAAPRPTPSEVEGPRPPPATATR